MKFIKTINKDVDYLYKTDSGEEFKISFEGGKFKYCQVPLSSRNQWSREDWKLLGDIAWEIDKIELLHDENRDDDDCEHYDTEELVRWIKEAAPMLSRAGCIIVDAEVDACADWLVEVTGIRAVLETCPVDYLKGGDE